MEKLQEHDRLPLFELRSDTDQTVGPQDFKEKKNLVLVFFDLDCTDCNDFLDEMSERYEDYQSENAEILAIGEGPLDRIKQVANARSLPFLVLADPDGNVLKMFSDSTPAIFVADRFGEIRMTRGKDDSHFPDQDKIIDRLDLAELECPECSV